MVRHVVCVVLASAILTGCGGGPVPPVTWSDYVSGLKPEIDAATAAKDCIGLTVYRDMAMDGDLLESKPRQGPNADLIRYVEWSLQEAGCW